jgi:hypothetical protein
MRKVFEDSKIKARILEQTRKFELSILLSFIVFAVSACITKELNRDGADDLTEPNDMFVRHPPGPECPTGQFLAGPIPHLSCMTEEVFLILYGERHPVEGVN